MCWFIKFFCGHTWRRPEHKKSFFCLASVTRWPLFPGEDHWGAPVHCNSVSWQRVPVYGSDLDHLNFRYLLYRVVPTRHNSFRLVATLKTGVGINYTKLCNHWFTSTPLSLQVSKNDMLVANKKENQRSVTGLFSGPVPWLCRRLLNNSGWLPTYKACT